MVNDVNIHEEDEIQVVGREAEKKAASQSLMKKMSLSNSPTKKSSHENAHTLDNFDNDMDKRPHPLDIIVYKIHTVVSNQSSDSTDEDDYNTTKEINHALQMQGFRVVEKENGADCEIVTFDSSSDRYDNSYTEEENPLKPSGSKSHVLVARRAEQKKEEKLCDSKHNFKKGHRRAYSMPNAHRERAVLVVTDDQVRQEGPKKRHVVRYRLHPYKPSPKANAAVNSFIEQTNFELPFELDDNADEFEIELDEEEIYFPGDQMETKESRIVLRKIGCKTTNFYGRVTGLPWLALALVSKAYFLYTLRQATSGHICMFALGCVAFLGMAAWFIAQPANVMAWIDKVVFFFFFLGAICCLGLSFCFHTVQCHSQGVGRLFSKLDYSGITMLIVGSFIPWMYYGFYCRSLPMVIYISMIIIFGIAALIVSLWEKFAQPTYRPLRAIVFLAMGLSGCIPALHLFITDGFDWMIENAAFHWLLLMAALYIIGAATYAFRFPERFFPGKFDLFCQSHQLFHLFVIVAAYVHFYGITEMAMKRLQGGSCHEQLVARYGKDDYTNILDQYFRPY